MFGKVNDFMKQVQLMQKLMKDENFKKFVSHPKIQGLMTDPEFQKAMQAQNPQDLMNHPKMNALKDDPEVRDLLFKLDFKKLMSEGGQA
jgi:hypothetical protein